MAQGALRPSAVREVNSNLVLQLLRDHGRQTRAELARITSLTPQALGQILAELVADGLVSEVPTASSGPGRPPIAYELDPDGAYWIGIELQYRVANLGIVDACGTMRARRSVRHGGQPASETLRALSAAVIDVGASVDRSRVRGLGLVLEGVVDDAGESATAASAWVERDVPVRSILEDGTGHPTLIDTAPHATARAEVVRSGAHVGLVAVLHVSFGSSLLLAVDGTIQRGRHGDTGSLTHVPAPGATARCPCGRVGCLATVASVPQVASRYRQLSGRHAADAVRVIARAAEHDPSAKLALREFTDAVVNTAAGLLPYLDPEAVIVTGTVGGPASRGASAVVDQLRAALPPHWRDELPVEISPMGIEAPLWGAVDVAQRVGGIRP